MKFSCLRVQVFEGRSHALLQEAGINLVQIMREEGFYVERRIMSATASKRGRGSFGEASPIELPTPRELSSYADKCALAILNSVIEHFAGRMSVLFNPSKKRHAICSMFCMLNPSSSQFSFTRNNAAQLPGLQPGHMPARRP